MSRVDASPPKAEVATAGGFGSEQLTALKHSNITTYKQWQLQEERKQEREKALAEAYREYKEKQTEKAREGRHRRLAELQKSSAASSRCPPSLELSEDNEYAALMEKYGGRIRVQVPTLPPLENSSVLSSVESTATLVPKRPPVPKTLRAKQSELQVFRKSVMDSRRKAEDEDEGGKSSRAMTQRASLAPAALAAAPVEKATTLPPVEKKCFQSAMPKKDKLRQKQRSLLKATGVVFYKPQMKAHMHRILTAVELTFDKHGPQTWQDKIRNLAKPCTRENGRMTPITPTAD